MSELLKTIIVYAQQNTQPPAGGGLINNPIKVDSLAEFVHLLLEIVVQIGIPILVVAVVYVGFLFVAARGSPEGLKKAKGALLTVAIGAAIILGAFVISEAIQNTINSLK